MNQTYIVNVYRKQKWTFEVEASSADEAKTLGDALACDEPAHDDWAYDTTAEKKR